RARALADREARHRSQRDRQRVARRTSDEAARAGHAIDDAPDHLVIFKQLRIDAHADERRADAKALDQRHRPPPTAAAHDLLQIACDVRAGADRIGDRIARAEPEDRDRGLRLAGAAARLADEREAHDDGAVAAAEHDQIDTVA